MVSFPNAKINLGLSILQKREDGYHNIESCFYPVQWCDALEIVESNQPGFTSSGIEIPGTSENNLCLKVYQTLKKEFNIPTVHIHLHKNIPIGAGMGGGSSDAAFTLKMLNKMFGLNLSNEQMEEYLRPLGSDCGFFINNKPTICYEKGDQFKNTALNLRGHYMVIVYPEIHIATKEAYDGVRPQKPDFSLEKVITLNPADWKNTLFNDFEKSLFPKYPALKKVKETLYDQGAIYASMTGSGSAVYGLFDTEITLKNHFPTHYKIWNGVLD